MFAALIPVLASIASRLPGLFKQGGDAAAGGATAAAAPTEEAARGIKGLFTAGNALKGGAAVGGALLQRRDQKKAEGQALGSQLNAQAAQPAAPQAGMPDPGLQHILAALQRVMQNTQQPPQV
jgi:hypothetical protein